MAPGSTAARAGASGGGAQTPRWRASRCGLWATLLHSCFLAFRKLLSSIAALGAAHGLGRMAGS